MNLADEFRRWVADPSRTVDELCAVELLLDAGEGHWRAQNKQYSNDWNEKMRKRKERAGNPAYRPKIRKELLEQTLEVAHLIKHFNGGWSEDRPLRSFAPLRFFPSIEDVHATCEATDFSPLHELPNLRRLSIGEPHQVGGHVIKSLAGLEGLKLHTLSVGLRLPWPDLKAISALPALEHFSARLNLQALGEVEELPTVRRVALDHDYHCNTPVRDFHGLPRMPQARHLRVNCIADLAGVENLSEAIALDLVGPFQDLAPLEKLEKVTWLRLEGGRFMDLAPLARMPRLREFVMVREQPLDLSPLSEAPALREVHVERCAILRTELAALNAGFQPWSLDFSLPEPRPLGPLKIYSFKPDHPDMHEVRKAPLPTVREEFYGDDEHFSRAEARWFASELQQKFDQLLGKDWGDLDAISSQGGGFRHITFKRFKDILRMDEIIQVAREMAASSRLPWTFLISAEPHGDLSRDMDEIRAQRDEQERDWLDQEYDPEQEREDHEEFRKMRRELYERLEREHRLRLLQQQGEEINPADFSPGAKPAAPKKKDDDEDDEDFEDDDEGDLDELDEDEPEQSEFEEEMSFVFELTENCVWVSAHMLETFEATLGLRAEDWHALPEPPVQRPRPRIA